MASAAGVNVDGLRLPSLVMRRPAVLFWGFVLCHSIVWTLTPILTQQNGHHDIIELLIWGRHPQWGYWKHPPLQAWIVGALAQLPGKPLWGVYLGSQIAISACFWAVWRFAHDFVEPAYALLSVFLLEGITYYNHNSPKFDHDTSQLPLWALTVLLLWRALTSKRACYWLLCGLMTGFGLLGKYSMIFLLVALFAFMLVNADARQHFTTPGPYIAVVVAALVVAPHVIWMFENDFTTVAYALNRAESQSRFIDHLVNPLSFAFHEALELVPVMVMMGLLAVGSTSSRGEAAPARFARAFLLTVVFGPFLAYLAVSVIMGFQVRIRWGTPLWSFLGVFALSHLRPALTDKALRRFSYAFLSFAAIWVVLYVGRFALGPALTGHLRPENFPGRAVAAYVTAQWARNYGTPLPIVVGDKWLAENIGVYSPDRPDVYADLDTRKSPWADDEAFKQRGGVIIWDAVKDGNALPELWRKRFPGALVQPAVPFVWQTFAAVPPLRIAWAIVPPVPSTSSP